MKSVINADLLQINTYEQMAIHWGPIVLSYLLEGMLALLLLVTGWHLSNFVSHRLAWLFDKRFSDQMLRNFVKEFTSVFLKILLVISVASMLGIHTTSLIAALGALGVAIGLALQGSLSHFAGGVMILLFKPFREGDQIEALGITARVDDIHIFSTQLHTQDNKCVMMPNGLLANATVVNYDQLHKRRLIYDVVINADSDFDLAREVLLELAAHQSLILQEPKPVVVVSKVSKDTYTVSLRVWVKSQSYRELCYQLNEQVRDVLSNAKIGMPYMKSDPNQVVVMNQDRQINGDENVELIHT